MERNESNCQVVQVQPLGFSAIKLIILTIVLLIIGAACAQLHLLLAAIIPIYLLSVLYHLCSHNYTIGHYVLFKKVTWEDNFTYVSVMTSHTSVGKRTNSDKLLIAKILKAGQGEILIKVKEQFYNCKADSIQKLNEGDILRILGVKLDEYINTGLIGESYNISTTIFGEQSNLFSPNIIRVMLKYLSEQMGWIFLCILALISAAVIYLKTNNLQPLLLHLCVDCIILLFILVQSFLKLREFYSLYDWLGEKSYKVTREQRELQLKLSQLLVGDVVQLSWAQEQQEMLLYFRGVLVGNAELNVRQYGETKQTFKIALTDLKYLEDINRRKRHILYEGTSIGKLQKDRKAKIIITERSLGKYFKLWFQKSMNRQFDSMTQRILKQALWLLLAGTGGLVTYYILLSLSFSKALFPINKFQFNATLACFVFPLIFLANQVALLTTNIRLKFNEIYAFQSQVERMGFCSEIYIQIKELLQLNFMELLYKNKIHKFQNQDFVPNQQTVRAGSTHDSLLALVMFISLGYLDKSSTFLKQIYEKYQQYFRYSGPQDRIDITHTSSEKQWTVQRIYPLNERGMRSWLIEYDNRASYLITEINQINEAIFNFLGPKQDKKKRDAYIEEANLLMAEGRQLKAMFFRNLKDQKQKIRLSQSRELDISNQSRQNLQNKYEFGAFIVFDNFFIKQNSKAVQLLKQITDKQGQRRMKIAFVTNATKQTILGFQHINQEIPIYPKCSPRIKEIMVKKAMSEKGTIYVGSSIADYTAQMQADLSMQIRKQQLTMLYPCDISIKSAKQFQTILQNSRWLLESFIENLKLSFAVIFFQLLGFIYAERSVKDIGVSRSLDWNIITLTIFVVLPAITKQIFSKRPNFRSHLKNLGIFSPNFIIFLIFAVITCFSYILVIGKSSICSSEAGIHLMGGFNASECVNVDILMGSWAGVLYFCVFYGESSWIQAQDWGRMAFLPIWWGYLFVSSVDLKLLIGMNIIILVAIAFKKIMRMRRNAQQPRA